MPPKLKRRENIHISLHDKRTGRAYKGVIGAGVTKESADEKVRQATDAMRNPLLREHFETRVQRTSAGATIGFPSMPQSAWDKMMSSKKGKKKK